MEPNVEQQDPVSERALPSPDKWKWSRPRPWQQFQQSDQWKNATPEKRLGGIGMHRDRVTGWLIQEGMNPEEAQARGEAFVRKRFDENPDIYRHFTWQQVEERGLVEEAREAIGTLEDFAAFDFTWAEREKLIRLADRIPEEDLPVIARAMQAWTEDQNVDEHVVSQFFRNVYRGVEDAAVGGIQGVRKADLSATESALDGGGLVTSLSPTAFQEAFEKGNTNRLLGSLQPAVSSGQTDMWYLDPALLGNKAPRSLTPGESDQVRTAINRERKRMQWSSILGKVHREKADRLEGLEETFLGRAAGVTSGSIGYLLVGSIPGGQGVLAASFANDAYGRIGELAPDLPEDQKWGYALSVGILQARIEMLQRIPMLKGLNTGALLNRLGVNVAGRSGAAVNFTIKTAAGLGMEGGMELLQESVPGLAQDLLSELNEQVPGVDWTSELAPFMDMTPEMLLGMLPLVLLGSSHGTIQDAADFRDTLSDVRRLEAVGLNPEVSGRIASLAGTDLVAAAREYHEQYRHHRDPGSPGAVNARMALDEATRKAAHQFRERLARLEAAGMIHREDVVVDLQGEVVGETGGAGSGLTTYAPGGPARGTETAHAMPDAPAPDPARTPVSAGIPVEAGAHAGVGGPSGPDAIVGGGANFNSNANSAADTGPEGTGSPGSAPDTPGTGQEFGGQRIASAPGSGVTDTTPAASPDTETSPSEPDALSHRITLNEANLEQLPDGPARRVLEQLPNTFEEARNLAAQALPGVSEEASQSLDTGQGTESKRAQEQGSARRISSDADASGSVATGNAPTVTITRTFEPAGPIHTEVLIDRVPVVSTTSPVAEVLQRDNQGQPTEIVVSQQKTFTTFREAMDFASALNQSFEHDAEMREADDAPGVSQDQRGSEVIPKGIDDLLVNGGVPGNRGGAFNRWFDELTPAEFDTLWKSNYQLGGSSIREVIESRIRHPGNLHEWLMAGRADKFKKWGVSMSTIKKLRTLTGTLLLSHESLGAGIHGGRLSGRMHYELQSLIDSSKSYPDFKIRIGKFAERWLAGGRSHLPRELQ